jgi:hypothetical protein
LLRAIDSFRLAKVDARQASDRAVPRGLRTSKCDEARRLFEESQPIIDAAEQQGNWQVDDDGDRSMQVRKHLNSCGAPEAA